METEEMLYIVLFTCIAWVLAIAIYYFIKDVKEDIDKRARESDKLASRVNALEWKSEDWRREADSLQSAFATLLTRVGVLEQSATTKEERPPEAGSLSES